MSPRYTSTRPYLMDVIVLKVLIFKGRSLNRDSSKIYCKRKEKRMISIKCGLVDV